MARAELVHAVAARPHARETVSGDSWLVTHDADYWRFTVIDGLGHGVEAAHAAAVISEAVASAPLADIDATLEIAHAAARGTRGAAVSLAVVDLERELLTFGGLGNVEGRLLGGAKDSRLVPARGIVGAAVHRSRPVTFELPPRWLLLLHSDGLSSRLTLDWDGSGEVTAASLQAIVDGLMAAWGKQNDDATVLVAGVRAAGGD